MLILAFFFVWNSNPCPAKYNLGADNPIVPACENNHVEIVRMMLTHPSIDPTQDRCFAVQVVAQAGMQEVGKDLDAIFLARKNFRCGSFSLVFPWGGFFDDGLRFFLFSSFFFTGRMQKWWNPSGAFFMLLTFF
jgi:hypothetical protein